LDLLSLIIIFALALFVGYEVITKVPSTLHTPLMSGSNAISGIVIVGAIIIASNADGVLAIILSVVAIILATINVIGGFMVTDRMLAITLIVANIMATTDNIIARTPSAFDAIMIAPTITIPDIAFEPDIKGVCKVEGTFVITS
jgi:NAD(P) transhydrogenase subunit alpha